MRLKMSFGNTNCDERKFILVPLLGDIFSHFPLNSKTAASGLGRQCKVIQLQSRSRLLASDQWQVYVYHCSVSHKLNWEEAYANPSTNWSAQLHRKEGEEENGWHDRMKTETAATHSHFPMCLCLMVVKLSPQWIYYSFQRIDLPTIPGV